MVPLGYLDYHSNDMMLLLIFQNFEDGGEKATRLFIYLFSCAFGWRPSREIIFAQSCTNKQVFRGKPNHTFSIKCSWTTNKIESLNLPRETILSKNEKLDTLENWTNLKIGQNWKLDKLEKLDKNENWTKLKIDQN